MLSSARAIVTDCVNPHKNLAFEEALMRGLPDGQAVLFLWQNRHTVVVGAGQNAWRECRTSLLEAEGGTLARRSSGGGAVYHDMGNLNYSFILPPADYDVKRQSDVTLRALTSLGIRGERSGRNDLTADGRKFSGNAFRMMKTASLQHGTLLVDTDMDKVARYLDVPASKLAAKGVKSVHSRVVNLRELADIRVSDAKSAMIEAFRAEYGACPVERAEAISLPGLGELEEKYASWTWNYGASPQGGVRVETRFAWGGVEIVADVRLGKAEGVTVYTDAMDETLKKRLEEALLGCEWRGGALSQRAADIGEPDVSRWLADIR